VLMSARTKKPELIFGDSSGKVIYDELIRILVTLTGVPWGYHKRKKHIQYIGVADMPLRVVVVDPAAACKSSTHWSTQWHILVTAGDIESAQWENLITYDLQMKLVIVLNVVKRYDTERANMLAVVRSYVPDAGIAAEHSYIAEQRRIHGDVVANIYNKHIDRCLYDITVVIDS